MKRGAEGSIVVRKNPGYNPNLTKEYLVLNAGACVGEFDSKAEADALCAKVIDELPKREDSGLNRRQQLQYELRSAPKREVKKRRELKAEIALIKTQEGQAEQKSKTKRVKKEVETKTEAKAKTFHYHKKSPSHPGRRGRCTCKEGDDR